jgi:two-component SAPR family response regulator
MGEGVKALIVDDEQDVCFLLSSILKNKRLQTYCVNSITEAKEVLVKENPSIMFLDNHLPDGFGINFVEEIKKLRPDVKIVMITAHDAKSDKDDAYLRGVDFFIGKPFTRDTVFKVIETLTNNRTVWGNFSPEI